MPNNSATLSYIPFAPVFNNSSIAGCTSVNLGANSPNLLTIAVCALIPAIIISSKMDVCLISPFLGLKSANEYVLVVKVFNAEPIAVLIIPAIVSCAESNITTEDL